MESQSSEMIERKNAILQELAASRTRPSEADKEDPMGFYMRQVGRTPLLKPDQEKKLALVKEMRDHLSAIETELEQRLGSPPSALQTVETLTTRLDERWPILLAIAKKMDLPTARDLNRMVSDPMLREAVDRDPERHFVAHVAATCHRSQHEVEECWRDLSLDTLLLASGLPEILEHERAKTPGN